MMDSHLMEATDNSPQSIEESPDIRESILSTAAEIFATQGYRSTSLMDVVRKSGCELPVVKIHFESKRDVFLALIGKYFKEYVELLEDNHRRFSKALGKGGEAFEVWRKNTIRIFKYHATNPSLSRVVFRDAMSMDVDYSWIVDELSSLIKLQMMDVLHLLKNSGLIDVPDLDMAATLMLGSVNAAISEFVLFGKKRKPEAIADQVLEYFFRAMTPAGVTVEDAVKRLKEASARKPRAASKKDPAVEVKSESNVKYFFDKSINRIFQEQVRCTDLASLRGVDISLQFIIHGSDEHSYGLRIEDGSRMEIVHGMIKDPTITIEMSEEAYRRSLDGKLAEAMHVFIHLNQISDRRRYEQITELKGCLCMELMMDDGSVFPFKLIFNGSVLPTTVFRLTLDDYLAIGRGELYGMSAFVSGRLDVEGDKPFAMQLSNLLR